MTQNEPENDTLSLIEYYPDYDGISLRYYCRRDNIFVFEFKDVRRAGVDKWYEITTHNDMVAYRRGEMIRSLIMTGRALPTPYVSHMALKSAEQTPDDLKQAIALVAPNNFISNTLRVMFSAMPARILEDVRYFTHQDEAIAWLYTQG